MRRHRRAPALKRQKRFTRVRTSIATTLSSGSKSRRTIRNRSRRILPRPRGMRKSSFTVRNSRRRRPFLCRVSTLAKLPTMKR